MSYRDNLLTNLRELLGDKYNHDMLSEYDNVVLEFLVRENCKVTIAATPFTEYRPDGWPLCPVCGEDELMSLLTVPGNLLELYLTDHDLKWWQSRTTQDFIDAGLRCLDCGWLLDKAMGEGD